MCSAEDELKIVEGPRNISIPLDGTAIFYCRAQGEGTIQFSWRKDGEILSDADHLVISDWRDPSFSGLRIYQSINGSQYECVAENDAGETATASAMLTVCGDEDLPNGFPTITSVSASHHFVEEGDKQVLECNAAGHPDVDISWIQDMVPINLSNRRYIQSEGTLQITGFQKEDEGKYECVAENSLGVVVSDNLQLVYKPRPKVRPYFSTQFETIYEVMPGSSLNITCTADGFPEPLVNWRNSYGDDCMESQKGINILSLENIQQSANYTCVASWPGGAAQVEKGAYVRVNRIEPPSAPSNIKISEITNTSVLISWVYDGPNAEEVDFKVSYKPKLANDQDGSEISGLKTNYYTVKNLNPFTEYELNVVAENYGGRTASTVSFVKTEESFPATPPENVEAQFLTSNKISIQWEEPEKPNGRIIRYKIFYTADNETASECVHSCQSVEVLSNGLDSTISVLGEVKMYRIFVQAGTTVGYGPPSEPITVQYNDPTQPTQLRVVKVTATSIFLNWDYPITPNGRSSKVKSYTIHWTSDTDSAETTKLLRENDLRFLNNLQPNTLYYIWVTAPKRGKMFAMQKIAVKTATEYSEVLPTAEQDASTTMNVTISSEITNTTNSVDEVTAGSVASDVSEEVPDNVTISNGVISDAVANSTISGSQPITLVYYVPEEVLSNATTSNGVTNNSNPVALVSGGPEEISKNETTPGRVPTSTGSGDEDIANSRITPPVPDDPEEEPNNVKTSNSIANAASSSDENTDSPQPIPPESEDPEEHNNVTIANAVKNSTSSDSEDENINNPQITPPVPEVAGEEPNNVTISNSIANAASSSDKNTGSPQPIPPVSEDPEEHNNVTIPNIVTNSTSSADEDITDPRFIPPVFQDPGVVTNKTTNDKVFEFLPVWILLLVVLVVVLVLVFMICVCRKRQEKSELPSYVASNAKSLWIDNRTKSPVDFQSSWPYSPINSDPIRLSSNSIGRNKDPVDFRSFGGSNNPINSDQCRFSSNSIGRNKEPVVFRSFSG